MSAILPGIASAGITALGGALGGSSDEPDPVGRAEQFKLSNPLFAAEMDHRKGQDYIAINPKGRMGRAQRQSMKDAGLASRLGRDFLQGLGQFDPMEIAQMQFDLLDPILAERQAQNRYDLEGRLFSQGMLGGTSGDIRMGTLLDTQEDARRKLLFDSFQQGLAAQQHQLNMGSGLFNIGTGQIGNALNIQGMANDTFLTAASAAGGGGQPTGGITPMQALGAGMVNAGVTGMSNAADSLFQPNSYYGGPTGVNTHYDPSGVPWIQTVGK